MEGRTVNIIVMKKKGNSYKESVRRTKAWKDFSKRLRTERPFCELCWKKSKTLQVHHMDEEHYTDLDPNKFMVLCSSCHKYITQFERLRHIESYNPLWTDFCRLAFEENKMRDRLLEHVKGYCSEPLENIENYKLAEKDNFIGWVCHHRFECIETGGTENMTMEDLIENGLYYHRPASELVFMTLSEHSSLHMRTCRKSGKMPNSNHKGTHWKVVDGKRVYY